jgi:Mn-dependent DtxR family transcriptional regulator
MQKMPLIDCRSLIFSPQLSENRLAQALEAFGLGVLQRILCYALYLLGLNRSAIGRTLGIPPETAKSIIKAVSKEGLVAFEDRRRSSSVFLPQAPAQPPPITLREEEEDHVVVDFGIQDRSITLSREDPLQLKTVLLSMVNSGLLSTRQVSEAIKLTPSHTAALARRLHENGALSLVDQRQGQKQDYRVTPRVKAELIQQFAVDVITRGRTSSSALSEELRQRCSIAVPDRTVRHHLSRLGLGEITRSLPQLVAALKKNSSNGSRS